MRWKPGFRTKATAGFGAMLLATVVVAAVAMVQAGRGAERAARLARAEAEDLLLTQRLRFRLERIVADGQGYLLFGDRELLSRMRESWARVEETLQALGARISSPVGRSEVRAVTETAGAYRVIVDRAVAERAATGDIEALRRFERQLRVHREALDASVDRLWNEEMRGLDEGLNAVARSARRTRSFILGTTAVALLLSLLLARTVIRELARLYEHEGIAARRAREALAARDELLAIIAHDLRSPLTAVLMKAGLIRKKVPPGESGADLRRRAESIEVTARQMEHLIKSLLDAATIEAGRLTVAPARCDATDLLRATHDMFEPLAAAKSIDVDIREPSGPCVVWADRERTLQVLSNLFANAIKFTPEGGVITLCAEPAAGDVRFAVGDTGPGIPEELQARVFDRYWQAEKGGRRGAGLGLYIARGIVEASGGRMWLESCVNEGTTFFFTLPAADRVTPDPTLPADRGELTAAWLGHG
jgi:signal transduction histidine kinase